MNIVKISGGLGNQMFQYALYRSLKSKGLDVKVDLSYYNQFDIHSGYELNRVFGLSPDVATKDKVEKLSNYSSNYLWRLYFKYRSKKTHFYQKNSSFDASVFNLQDTYLDGYWQSDKYFIDISKMIISEFNCLVPCDDANHNLESIMIKSNSVSVHIRRGDYLNSYTHNVCNLDYYRKAIDYMNKNLDNPVFFIFSDDIEWAIENLDLDGAKFISWNTGEESYIDMILMSKCKHNVICNSSFSWWGAYLNSNPNKFVTAPFKWFKGREAYDIVPDNWHKIIFEI